jgi:hypothetical protein
MTPSASILVLTAVPLDDLAADTLPKVLIGRADDHLLDPRVGRGHHRCAGQTVVRLNLHHRPDHHTQGPQRILQQVELRRSSGSIPALDLYVGHTSLRNDSITWSVATPTWVAPSCSLVNTDWTTPRVAPIATPALSRCPGRGA